MYDVNLWRILACFSHILIYLSYLKNRTYGFYKDHAIQ